MGKRKLAKPPSKKEKKQAKSRWTLWAVGGGVGLIIVAAIAYLVMQSGNQPGKGQSALVPVGSPAPDFTLTLFNGQTVALSSLKGKPVVLNFWAST